MTDSFSPLACLPIMVSPFSMLPMPHAVLVHVQGKDAQAYLQGQITADVNALLPHQVTWAAHCDATGKVYSIFLLFRDHAGFSFITSAETVEQSIAELSKYAVFSKVTFTVSTDTMLVGCVGQQAETALLRHFPLLPTVDNPVVTTALGTLIFQLYPHPRFLLIALQDTLALFAEYVNQDDKMSWLALDIAAGYAQLRQETTQKFLPQALNLHALNAINFKKGCYVGQEMVARAKYRGANKRKLFWLVGQGGSLPQIGASLSMQLGENWRNTGTVLAAVMLPNNQLWVQAVLDKSITPEVCFRVNANEPTAQLHACDLPYSLDE